MKHFLFILCFCVALGLHAQAIVSSSSIAIQGLLKNELGEPISNISGLELDFKVYYLNSSNNETTIKSVSADVKTDAYGVFNYVINLNETQVNTLSYYASYTKVTLGSTEIFDQQLRAVPYAIHAKNGYPTGTVLPYMGEEAPAGWLLCNGQNIPDTYFYENLIAIIGNTTPNLNAMFLRGTGTRSVGGKSYSGEALGGYGGDRNPDHRHNINITTSEDGEHRHPIRRDSYGSDDGDDAEQPEDEVDSPLFYKRDAVCYNGGQIKVEYEIEGTNVIVNFQGSQLDTDTISGGEVIFTDLERGTYVLEIANFVKVVNIGLDE